MCCWGCVLLVLCVVGVCVPMVTVTNQYGNIIVVGVLLPQQCGSTKHQRSFERQEGPGHRIGRTKGDVMDDQQTSRQMPLGDVRTTYFKSIVPHRVLLERDGGNVY